MKLDWYLYIAVHIFLFLNHLTSFIQKKNKNKKHKFNEKNAWSNFYCIFHKESIEKKTHQNQMRNKVAKLGHGHFWTPCISITVRVRSWRLWPICWLFHGEYKDKNPIKIGQEIEKLHPNKENSPSGHSPKIGGVRSPKINTNPYVVTIINVPKY